MKPNELFVGALVCAESPSGICKVKEIFSGNWIDTNGIRHDYELTEQIPLTPEILEKNGFYKIKQQDCVEPFYWKMEHYDEDGNILFNIVAFRNFSNGLKVYIYNPSACESIYLTKQIKFVHELQVALRLCELEIEITI